ncbi:MAG TPA: hypothetical protein VFE62_02605 [Gemmataceae bacterium]|nr:hypothetical protein [Pirellulales bacterium]HZZ77378.1 hypothetical protein [Gemmataceae bacterium]
MAHTLDKVSIDQRITVFVWAEEQAKVIPCSMTPAIFRNPKKFADELRKAPQLATLQDDTIRQIWETAVEEVLARQHLNTFQV